MSQLLALFHLTHQNKRDSIQRNGLLPQSNERFGYENKIFLFSNKQDLNEIIPMICGVRFDLWQIDNSKLNMELTIDEFAKLPGCFFTTEKIPAKYLTLIKSWSEINEPDWI